MKKKLLFMAAVCALWSTTYAQTEMGKRLVGGNFGFSIANDETSTLKSNEGNFNVAPYIGYFASKNLVLAISVGFSKSGIDYVNTAVEIPRAYTTQENMFSITPFVRYYMPISPRFKIFGQFNAYTGFGTASITYENPTQGNNGSLMIKEHGAGLLPGISFFPNTYLGLECSFSGLSYSNWSFSTDENAKLVQNRSFSFSINSINPNIGINYYF